MVKLTSILIASILIFVSDALGHGEGKCKVIGSTHFVISHFTPNAASDPDGAGNRPLYAGGHGHIETKVGDDKIYSWGYWSKLSYEIVKHIPDRIQGWIKCTIEIPSPPLKPTPKPAPKPKPVPPVAVDPPPPVLNRRRPLLTHRSSNQTPNLG